MIQNNRKFFISEFVTVQAGEILSVKIGYWMVGMYFETSELSSVRECLWALEGSHLSYMLNS